MNASRTVCQLSVLVLATLAFFFTLEYVSRGASAAEALRDAACAAHEGDGSCTSQARVNKEGLFEYCDGTRATCDAFVVVATAKQTLRLMLKDTTGIENRAQLALWALMALSSPAVWAALAGIAAMCVIVSYGRAWVAQSTNIVGTVAGKLTEVPDRDIPLAIPVGAWPVKHKKV
jgi:hypothetical protein